MKFNLENVWSCLRFIWNVVHDCLKLKSGWSSGHNGKKKLLNLAIFWHFRLHILKWYRNFCVGWFTRPRIDGQTKIDCQCLICIFWFNSWIQLSRFDWEVYIKCFTYASIMDMIVKFCSHLYPFYSKQTQFWV